MNILVIPDDGKGIVVSAELELDDLLPMSIGSMPPFIKGRITKLALEDRLWLKMAQKHRIIFNETQLIYDAILDTDSGEFRAVDTTERGI